MGDNKEERKKMKKTRYVALVLLSSLLTLVGCSRREILDDYPVTGINIRLDWEGVTGRLPEGIRVIFYPKDAQGRKIDTYAGKRRRNESAPGALLGSDLQL